MGPSDPAGAPARLTIDLDAVAANWRHLARLSPTAAMGAAVKADAYGLGADAVVPALVAAGCRDFFVAHLDEGLAIASLVPKGDRIYVLHGVPAGTADTLRAAGLVPVLCTLGDVERWTAEAARSATVLPAVLHLDTGINRLGLSADDLADLLAEPDRLSGLAVQLVMSHLACADDPTHPLNRRQLQRFVAATAHPRLAGVPRSLANSGGVLLGPDYHFQLARPGIALYGADPRGSGGGGLLPVVRLDAEILQIRDVDAPDTVGYGASHRVPGPRRIATIAVGYADGYLRAAGNRGTGLIGGVRVPIVGRISMDLMTLDVTEVPIEQCRPGTSVTLIDETLSLDSVTSAMDTIPYELLTRLGHRFARHYVGGAA